MSLHVESYGSGDPLVLLHGWGMHGGVWEPVLPGLASHFRVHCVDLPGYGASPPLAQPTLDGLVQVLSERFTGSLHLCGWSLGGQIALRWAGQSPAQIGKLALIASTPRFVKCEGWSCAVSDTVLQEFADALLQDGMEVLRRFVALQVRGSTRERELLAAMRECLFGRGVPQAQTLLAGLGILRDTDLRSMLAQIGQPALVIAGERDLLTPPAASAWMAHSLPRAIFAEIRGAAHAPFLSHPDMVVRQLVDFLESME